MLCDNYREGILSPFKRPSTNLLLNSLNKFLYLTVQDMRPLFTKKENLVAVSLQIVGYPIYLQNLFQTLQLSSRCFPPPNTHIKPYILYPFISPSYGTKAAGSISQIICCFRK